MSHFFAYLSRMKYILRWNVMRNTRTENVQEHSLQTAMIAHSLALIHSHLTGERINAERVAVLALYHEAGEVITGDLVTPIKYRNPDIMRAYKAIEQQSNELLLNMLPDELREYYENILIISSEQKMLYQFVKAADTICAYLKCIEEEKAGNTEFLKAKQALENKIRSFNMPCVVWWMERFAPSFNLTLDELN